MLFRKTKHNQPPSTSKADNYDEEGNVEEIKYELTLNRLFTRCHINIIQPSYVPDISSALDMSKLILQTCGDTWNSLPVFNRTAAENFLAAVIWMFVNFRPSGYKNGILLKHMIHYTCNNGMSSLAEDDLSVSYKGWSDYTATDGMGNEVLDFVNNKGENLSMDDDGQQTSLEDLSYNSKDGFVTIAKNWYIDFKGRKAIPDTYMGQYSDLGHVIQFIFSPYDKMFSVMNRCDPQIKSLILPFVSAYQNKAMDQFEAMMGTLRLTLSRMVSPMAYFLFTAGDDIHLKDKKEDFAYKLVITSDKSEGTATSNILHLYGELAKKYGWKVAYEFTGRDKTLETQPILGKNFKRICKDIANLFDSVNPDSDVSDESTSENTQPKESSVAPSQAADDASNELDEMYYSIAGGGKKK